MADSVLIDSQRHEGAVFADGHPWAPEALHFGDPAGEYRAAVNEAALFDLSDRTHIEITGEDRTKFLNNLCTQDIPALQPGQGCEAFVTNVKGRIVAHVFVFITPNSIWLETVPGLEETLLAHLDRYHITEDVELHRRRGEWGEVLVSGNESARKLGTAEIDVEALDLLEHRAVEAFGHSLFVRRVDWLSAPAYGCVVPRDRLVELWQTLIAAGCRPAGSQAFHGLRIEAGLPLYGIDISDANLAQEASRTGRAISFTKGCYLGQEPIARLDALGHVNKQLRGLRLSEQPIPEPGSPVIAGDEGKEIGKISSSAFSYQDQKPVALAILRAKFSEPGTEVTVQVGEETVPATVFWPEGLDS